MNPWLEMLVPIVGIILSGAASAAVVFMKQYFNVKIEEKDMNVLHSALQTGVNAAVSKASNDKIKEIALAPFEDVSIKQLKEQIVQDAVAYANKSAKDAISRLNPAGGILANIALSKLEELLAEKMKK